MAVSPEDIESTEAAMEAARKMMRDNPDIDEEFANNCGYLLSKPKRNPAPKVEKTVELGKKKATVTVTPTQMLSPDQVRAARIELMRPDCGIQAREAEFEPPARITPSGLYLEEPRGRGGARFSTPKWTAMDLGSVFTGDKKTMKTLRSQGVVFK